MTKEDEAFNKLMKKRGIFFFLIWGSLVFAFVTVLVSYAITINTGGKNDSWFLPHYKFVGPIFVLCVFVYFCD